MNGTKVIALVLGISTMLMLISAGCSRGTYPLDYFYEMHYQQSYASHEPPRLSVPQSAVPINGKETPLLPGDVANLVNPLMHEGGRSGIDQGQQLFVSNCVICHGTEGLGNGLVLETMIDKYGYMLKLSPDLTAIGALSDGQLFSIITDRDLMFPGVEGWVMPQFGRLLTADERWALVNYIRELQGR